MLQHGSVEKEREVVPFYPLEHSDNYQLSVILPIDPWPNESHRFSQGSTIHFLIVVVTLRTGLLLYFLADTAYEQSTSRTSSTSLPRITVTSKDPGTVILHTSPSTSVQDSPRVVTSSPGILASSDPFEDQARDLLDPDSLNGGKEEILCCFCNFRPCNSREKK